MRAKRAQHFLSTLTAPALKNVTKDGQVVWPIREAIDRLFENVFSTVAFQSALVCTYAEAVQEALGGIEQSTTELLDEYLGSLKKLFAPENIKDLVRLMRAFEGSLEVEPEVKLVGGGPVFRGIVLSGELQPAEWPKYRYLLIELWESNNPTIRPFIEADRANCRTQVAQSLYERRRRAYCEEHRIADEDLTKAVKDEIAERAKTSYEEFLGAIHDKKISLEEKLFETAIPSIATEESDDSVPSA